MIVTLLSITPNSERLIETAGRVCYRSEGVNTAEFIRRRIRDGHLSILEHASATFLIEGISRACSHQLVRHRLCSFSQESQRYVNMDYPGYVIPPEIASNVQALEGFESMMAVIFAVYRKLRADGIKKEDARFVLPNATHTRLVMTANFRQWLHIFDVRLSPHAQWEIRNVCEEVLRLLYQEAPNVFGQFYTAMQERTYE